MESGAKLDNRLFILILQHPRERHESVATAELAVSLLRRARLVVGLSWPNLQRALGDAEDTPVDARRWAVLHLGSVRPRALGLGRPVIAIDRHGQAEADQPAMLRALDGAVLLDGSWREAKALWWRNPWLLKLRRLVLDPQHPARYHRVRREPRREALSTIEAAALLLQECDRRADIATALGDALDRWIATARMRPGAPRRDPP
ncbi:MAG TPA: tRNA-uridine aminocarboxypropyltransferase [Stellaceae bacterium]|nr:tRNA-uridine aminocarboxypropyltransferase [Stellaceae bacterium]